MHADNTGMLSVLAVLVIWYRALLYMTYSIASSSKATRHATKSRAVRIAHYAAAPLSCILCAYQACRSRLFHPVVPARPATPQTTPPRVSGGRTWRGARLHVLTNTHAHTSVEEEYVCAISCGAMSVDRSKHPNVGQAVAEGEAAQFASPSRRSSFAKYMQRGRPRRRAPELLSTDLPILGAGGQRTAVYVPQAAGDRGGRLAEVVVRKPRLARRCRSWASCGC